MQYYWGTPIGADGVIEKNIEYTKFLDSMDNVFYYGHTVFKDGKIVKWCRPVDNHGQ